MNHVSSFVSQSLMAVQSIPMLVGIIVTVLMSVAGSIVYRFIGGGFFPKFEGRGKRFMISVPSYLAFAALVGYFTQTIGFTILTVILYFILMFAARSPEIGCYYIWQRQYNDASETSVVIVRQPKSWYNHYLIERFGYFTARKIRNAYYPTLVYILMTLIILPFAVSSFVPTTSTIYAVLFLLPIAPAMLMIYFLAYVDNVEYAGGFYAVDIELAEFVVGFFTALASIFFLCAI